MTYKNRGCISLTEVTIGKSVKHIGERAFAKCENLETVTCYAETVPSTESDAFQDSYVNYATLIVPGSALNAYKSTAPWSDFGTIEAYDDVVESIINLVDGESYTNLFKQQCEELTYTRPITDKQAGNWQSLYIPMSVDVAAHSDLMDIAEIYAICPLKDSNGDGNIDANDNDMLILNILKDGVTTANVPYVFRPKAAGDLVMTSSDKILHAAENGTITVATSKNIYDFRGLNENFTVVANDNNYYIASGSGNLSYKTSGSATVTPYRWIMHRSPKSYGNASSESPSKEMEIFVMGEDVDAIDVDHTINNTIDKSGTYTLDGRRVMNADDLKSGVYISNGKKVLVK